MCRGGPMKAKANAALLLHSAFNSCPQCSMGNAIASQADGRCADGGWGIRRADARARLDDDFVLGQHWAFDNAVGADADAAGTDQAAIDAGVRGYMDVSIALGAAVDVRA